MVRPIGADGCEFLFSRWIVDLGEFCQQLAEAALLVLPIAFLVAAAYFAWRLATDVQTGPTTSDGNHQGLTDARRWFEV